MFSGELLHMDQAGATGPVNILARQAMAGMGMELGEVAAAQDKNIGDRLGGLDPTCPERWVNKRLISLEDLAKNGNAPIIFSGLQTDVAAEHEDDLAKNRLVVTNASANRMRPDVPIVNSFINADHIDELYARDMEGRIIAGGNCMSSILIAPIAALHRRMGVETLKIETLQGWSGAGKSEIPQDVDDITDITGDEAEKIRTEPNKILGTSMDQPTEIDVLKATPKRGPWVRGHQAVVEARLGRKTTKREVEYVWRNLRVPAALADVKHELQALSEVGGERWPHRHETIKPIKRAHHELVRYDVSPARLARIHPMRTNTHLRGVEVGDPSIIHFEVSGDNLMLGAVGVNMLNVLYARAKGYV